MSIHELAERTRTGPLARHDPGSVLVAVDGSSSGWDALAWACEEADARATDLRIVQTHPMSGSTSDGGTVLAEAVERASAFRPSVPVTTMSVGGDPSIAIPAEGSDDALIVVGRECADERSRPWAWPASWAIAERSTTSVVIVDCADRARHGPSSGRVVACLGERTDAFAVLGFALRAALRWGVGVTALHIDADVSGADEASAAFARPAIDSALRAAQDAFPDVGIRHRAVTGDLAAALAAESVASALVVLGPSSHRAPFSRVRRSLTRVSRGVVAVVH